MLADSSINLIDYYVGYYGDNTLEKRVISWSGGLLYDDNVDDRFKDFAYPSILDILTNFPFPSSLLKMFGRYMSTGLRVMCQNIMFDYDSFPMKFRVYPNFRFNNVYSLHANISKRDLREWLESEAAQQLMFSVFAIFNITEDSYSITKYEIDEKLYPYLEGQPGYYLSDDLDELKQIALEKLDR